MTRSIHELKNYVQDCNLARSISCKIARNAVYYIYRKIESNGVMLVYTWNIIDLIELIVKIAHHKFTHFTC